MKTKNNYPSSEFEHEDKCPSCGSPCNIHIDLDDNDECNECRNQIDGLEMGQIIPKEEPKQETSEEAAEKFYPPKTTDLICSPKLVRDSFIAGAKWQQEQDKNLYSEEDLLKFGAFVRIEDKKEKRLFLIQDYYKKWFNQFKKQ